MMIGKISGAYRRSRGQRMRMDQVFRNGGSCKILMDDKTKNLVYAVEDDEGIQELYQGALEENYDVRIFPDGESFLDAFALKKPALVLLDIMLPDMDGYSILVKIQRARRAYARL